MRARSAHFANFHRSGNLRDPRIFRLGDESETDLPAARQLDIDLRKKLGVEERAMLGPAAPVDSEPRAQGVEAVLRAGVAASGDGQGVDHPAHADDGPAANLQLMVEETEI